VDNLIIVGDRVLIAPDEGEQQTKAGLYLPASVAESERVQHGRVVKVGPGYVVPNPEYSEDETWKQTSSIKRYLPLQADPGDVAYFMRKEAITVTYRDKKYLIIPHSAILFLVRPTAEDILGTILPSDDA